MRPFRAGPGQPGFGCAAPARVPRKHAPGRPRGPGRRVLRPVCEELAGLRTSLAAKAAASSQEARPVVRNRRCGALGGDAASRICLRRLRKLVCGAKPRSPKGVNWPAHSRAAPPGAPLPSFFSALWVYPIRAGKKRERKSANPGRVRAAGRRTHVRNHVQKRI